ncbi:MAG: hypothetical protein ACRDSE_05400 [Pseudonocardiaceae bacterium]
MAIPTKRHERSTVSYLGPSEIDALLAAPDLGNWLGRRDRALEQRARPSGRRAISDPSVALAG